MDQGPVDYRSDPMPSPEGRGRARDALRRAWEAYSRTANRALEPTLGPLVKPLEQKLAAAVVVDLTGFWLIWHLEGGFEGLQRVGMSRAAIYRRVALFRRYYGAHPDEFRLDGVEIDLDAYVAGSGKPLVDRATHPRANPKP